MDFLFGTFGAISSYLVLGEGLSMRKKFSQVCDSYGFFLQKILAKIDFQFRLHCDSNTNIVAESIMVTENYVLVFGIITDFV